MKVFPGSQSRPEYLATQITRSRSKFRYCKVSIRDVLRYREVVARDLARRGRGQGPGPIACLGTRSGREVDLFRIGFFGGAPRRRAVALAEIRRHGHRSLLPPLEAWGRSDAGRLGPESVVGVEVNPDAARRDVWIGSFDAMPADWERRFGVVFSNSFDQSQDPWRSAAEWRRITRPGGYLIVCFAPGAEPSAHDPVGQLTLEDLQALFGGELVDFRPRGSRRGYSEAIFRAPLEREERAP
jgi:hypothetical protein